MIISVGVQYEYGDYTISIEGVIGSFNISLLPDLEQSVDNCIQGYKDSEDFDEEFYAKIVMKMVSEYDPGTGVREVWFDEISFEPWDYL